MLGPFEQLSVLMLTHLLFAPLGDVTHTLLLYDDISSIKTVQIISYLTDYILSFTTFRSFYTQMPDT